VTLSGWTAAKLTRSSEFAHFAAARDSRGHISSMLLVELQRMRFEARKQWRSPSRLREFAGCLAVLVALVSAGGCASKRFTPRILAEMTTVRDAKSATPSRPAAARTRAKAAAAAPATPPAASKLGTVAATADRGSIGTAGVGAADASVAPNDVAMAPPAQNATPSSPTKTEGTPVRTLLAAATEPGGLVVAIALAIAGLATILYRRISHS
jgi:hypothetical protein